MCIYLDDYGDMNSGEGILLSQIWEPFQVVDNDWFIKWLWVIS